MKSSILFLIFIHYGLCHVFVDKIITPGEEYFSFLRNMTLKMTVYNTGPSAIQRVKIFESWPLDGFALIEGEASQLWDELPPNDNVSLTCVLRTLLKARKFNIPQTVVTYIDENQQKREVRSTNNLNMYISDDYEYEKATNKHYKEWGLFGGSFFILVIIPMLLWFIGENKMQTMRKEKKM